MMMNSRAKLHSLTNHDFRSRIIDLQYDEKFCDITFQLPDNSKLTAHKAIVYSFCKTAEMLCNKDNIVAIQMPQITPAVLRHVMNFIYGQMIVVENQCIGAIYLLAQYLEIEDLKAVMAPLIEGNAIPIKDETPDVEEKTITVKQKLHNPIFHSTIFNDVSDFTEPQPENSGIKIIENRPADTIVLADKVIKSESDIKSSCKTKEDDILSKHDNTRKRHCNQIGFTPQRINSSDNGLLPELLIPSSKVMKYENNMKAVIILEDITDRYPELIRNQSVILIPEETAGYDDESEIDYNDDEMTMSPIMDEEVQKDELKPDQEKLSGVQDDTKPESTQNPMIITCINAERSEQPKQTRYATRKSNTQELLPGIVTPLPPSYYSKNKGRPQETPEQKKRALLYKKIMKQKKKDYEWVPKSVIKAKRKKQKERALEKLRKNQAKKKEMENQENGNIDDFEVADDEVDGEEEEILEELYSDSDSEIDPDEIATEKPLGLAIEMKYLMKAGDAMVCVYCPEKFENGEERFNHIAEVHPESEITTLNKDNMKCDTCRSKFRKKIKYLQHKLVCTPEALLAAQYCPLCDETYSNLNYHIKSVHTEKNLKCRQCPKQFSVMDKLKEHIRVVHPLEKIICEICAMELKNNYSYRFHKKTQHGNEEDRKKFVCQTCGKYFALKKQYTSHMEVHADSYDFECDQCEKKFTSKKKLRYHVINSHEAKLFTCDQCGFAFPNNSRLTNHINKVHLGIKMPPKRRNRIPKFKHECPECEKCFRKKENLVVHLRWHRKPHKCEITTGCNKAFKSLSYLIEHLKKQHGVDYKFLCGQCNEEFPSKLAQIKHVASVHELKQLFDCDKCEHTFPNLRGLKKHKRDKHNIFSLIQCKSCQLYYPSTNALGVHRTLVHKGKKPVVCRLCGLVIENSWYRQKHWVHRHKIRKLDNPDDLSELKVKPFILVKQTSHKDYHERQELQTPYDLSNPHVAAIEPNLESLLNQDPEDNTAKSKKPPKAKLTKNKSNIINCSTSNTVSSDQSEESLAAMNLVSSQISNKDSIVPSTAPLINTGSFMDSLTENGPLMEPVTNTDPLMNSVTKNAPLMNSVTNTGPLMNSVTNTVPLVNSDANAGFLMNSVTSTGPLKDSVVNTTPLVNSVTNTGPLMDSVANTDPLMNSILNTRPMNSILNAGSSVNSVQSSAPLINNHPSLVEHNGMIDSRSLYSNPVISETFIRAPIPHYPHPGEMGHPFLHLNNLSNNFEENGNSFGK
ncbi:unnamed protein product [Owenia fusiformis]|uniref:Uncharacterized protein n=1 Tax=Owenia fusiformis TaxID=6347 RepID=A0A8J1U6K6_OWEFU|nr:unnamed protein product [Owenia fusiformis]